MFVKLRGKRQYMKVFMLGSLVLKKYGKKTVKKCLQIFIGLHLAGEIIYYFSSSFSCYKSFFSRSLLAFPLNKSEFKRPQGNPSYSMRLSPYFLFDACKNCTLIVLSQNICVHLFKYGSTYNSFRKHICNNLYPLWSSIKCSKEN